MAVAEQDRAESQSAEEGGGHGTALKAAGAAAATGAAAFALQKMLAQRSKGSKDENGKADGQGSVFASAAAGGWDAAQDAIVPLAENAAGAAGKYLAEHAPDFVREHVVPKFIDGFNGAKD